MWTEHESVGICRRQQTEPVDLDHCLRAFTSEEKLEECYHCSNCKSKQPATKKLQIWKLPPILIVHLKRFNFVNNKWVKSQKVVNFPFKDFDPTPYLASIPQETILRHKELLEHGNAHVMSNGPLDTSSSSLDTTEMSPEHSVISDSIKEIETADGSSDTSSEPAAKPDDSNYYQSYNSQTAGFSEHTRPANHKGTGKEHSATAKSSTNASKRMMQNSQSVNMRKRLVSTSLIKSPVIDGAFIDHHDHNLDDGADPFDLKYKLYAVVVSDRMHFRFY